MMFRTEYIPRRSPVTLSPEKPVTLLGSCFSDNIGQRMRDALWDARVNPCGVLYNPLSILRILTLAVDPDENDIRSTIMRKDDFFISFLMDSGFAGKSEEEVYANVSQALSSLRTALGCSQALIVTLGTAWVHRLLSTGKIVGNCHKFPSGMFRRELLAPEDSASAVAEIEAVALRINPEIRVIFTISPVRHLRDDFHENTLSKATLHLSLRGQEYFPAYEILMDDLRDYRFYASDMAHPSTEASGYIWEKFINTYLDSRGIAILNEAAALVSRVNHRPLVPFSTGSEEFREKTRRLVSEFHAKYPTLLIP